MDSSINKPSLDQSTDPLSNHARAVLRLRVKEAYTNLVPTESCDPQIEHTLSALSPADLFAVPITDPQMGACVHSALWLWHGALDESHKISQVVENPTGSFWHAIMHRQEGDFSNSKYWYARTGKHPVLMSLGIQANDVIANAPADKALLRLTQNGWNGSAFVDFVESVHRKPDDSRYLVAVVLQQLEWRVLFDYCVRMAVGK